MDEATTATATDHGRLEVLGYEECLELMATRPVGRVAFVDAGEPVILPVNHAVDGSSVVFRTTHGSKLSAAVMQTPAAFEVDAYDEDTRTGWSVLVRGRVDIVDEPDEVERLEALGLHPWADEIARETFVRLYADDVSGRRIAARG